MSDTDLELESVDWRPGLASLDPPVADHGLTISAITDGKASVVALAGELDLNTAAQAQQALIAELGTGPEHLLVDLRRLEFCDAAGLRVFLRVRREALARGARVRLVHAGRTVRRVLEVADLEWLIAEPALRPPVTPRRARWCST
jgi:anti-sigma B factor antagonist